MNTLPLDHVPLPLHAALERDWQEILAALEPAAREAVQSRLAADAALAAALARVLGCSQFVAQALARDSELLPGLLESGDLARSYEESEFRQRLALALPADVDEARLATELRRLRRREMVRIVWRDLLRSADLVETTRDLTWLAEATVEAAVAHGHAQLAARHGEPRGRESGAPQRLVVLGMGKLGACELNLSSDIDLIFAYPEQGETDGERALSNQEFFTRLGQRVIKAIDAKTQDGFVFRVDMRLRPYGDAGALALNFDAMEEYYQDQGRDWERYAMIKARVIAGDRAAGEQLLAALRPFTYRRYIDFSAIESLRGMKAMINREVQRRGKTTDVKLGAGGIREIEFIVQSFQLIRGGRETALQERRLLVVLELLGALGHLPATVVAQLGEAYVFLRNTEHAIQARADQQTQALPEDEHDRLRLAFALGLPDWSAFAAELERHRAHVRRHFADVVAAPQEQHAAEQAAPDAWRALWAMEKEPERLLELLEATGFEDPAGTLERLGALRNSNRLQALQSAGRERLERFMPLLLAAAAATEHPSAVIARTMALVESVLRRSAYLVLLEENPGALEQLVRLCSASPWIAQELANHPVLLDELIDPRALYTLPERATLAAELQQHMLRIPLDDLEAQMEALRYFKLAHRLRCAASEVTGALPLMKVSDYLSFLAETILGHVLAVAWHYLVERHGTPQKADGVPCDPDFIVVAYGKLGGIELAHGSDLDLVFIHDADPMLATDGERAIENGVFFTRLGQRIIHVLTAYTPLGQLYEVDMRLRPSGAAGLLVSSLTAFREYQYRQAWTWEHQALVRARPVAGCPRLAARFEELRREVLAQPRELPRLRREVIEMRDKMRAHLLKPETSGGKSPRFDLKQSVGGIVDIEFLVQYCVLAWSENQAALSVYTDNIRILEALSESGLMASRDAQVLTEAYKAYRTVVHRLTLQQQDDIVPALEYQALRDEVVRVWDALLGSEPTGENNT
ncbi:MAG: bifunctional [glutamate--ammonia ligase]-adenylyl-L-tyrosine phosphorylase/[glutamate--ammonia-ligase] adenylyltransferase [Gammaproteobacteria bacterium]|nr:bifunctional [glutamate--ammonia ligase]-adenylyl-L-tyrosine phosphorylase/[glutamate--ammonia-ligase] adenylyltransferase [Gammaproteobacteria bacterium]MBP6480350.1 bifunctional [glutamate--ammonia ligase]-adenylyl-L-tyrosine phosphorylase/[glutamate--ammonia-ligase] adenylyltransferase [Pseudomonadales bacterium]MBP7909968.1 bifunctional [glutamate--ammonia ligase]-adenylyl-L-tyrosine phosphorylase/[glutamate--ammonia-ligase] adenylyltransferase [Pseudomonadales bacterium]